MHHCVATSCRIVTRGAGDRRDVFQLGYNLGRLSELTGQGREPFWDRWKVAVANWDQTRLTELARELRIQSSAWVPSPANSASQRNSAS
jgi:hypothetical protein